MQIKSIIDNSKFKKLKVTFFKKNDCVFIHSILVVSNNIYVSTIKNRKEISLNLLKEKALKADFKVAFLVVQKLISTNEVRPISSQPKNNIKVLPDITKKTILIINKFKKRINLGTEGSYLK